MSSSEVEQELRGELAHTRRLVFLLREDLEECQRLRTLQEELIDSLQREVCLLRGEGTRRGGGA